ncbi:Putative metallo-dependent phosphatase [Colletotrichum destructivum]|uniref:Metallo-dependent phosphatase n=1 Tax=Colletotrichum destructivum TaxID=34406 RepID=A0AAX4I2Y2_9PEZI|nr:Putative metallo-dependent phosphatase [Colletotrichum destructivum]
MSFIKRVLDAETPETVFLTGNQIYHNIADSESAPLKLFTPFVRRSIFFTAVLSNHEDNGGHTLSHMKSKLIYGALYLKTRAHERHNVYN